MAYSKLALWQAGATDQAQGSQGKYLTSGSIRQVIAKQLLGVLHEELGTLPLPPFSMVMLCKSYC